MNVSIFSSIVLVLLITLIGGSNQVIYSQLFEYPSKNDATGLKKIFREDPKYIDCITNSTPTTTDDDCYYIANIRYESNHTVIAESDGLYKIGLVIDEAKKAGYDLDNMIYVPDQSGIIAIFGK